MTKLDKTDSTTKRYEENQPSRILRYASHIFFLQSGTSSASEMPNNHATGDPASPQSTHWSSDQVLRIPKPGPYFGRLLRNFFEVFSVNNFFTLSQGTIPTRCALSFAAYNHTSLRGRRVRFWGLQNYRHAKLSHKIKIQHAMQASNLCPNRAQTNRTNTKNKEFLPLHDELRPGCCLRMVRTSFGRYVRYDTVCTIGRPCKRLSKQWSVLNHSKACAPLLNSSAELVPCSNSWCFYDGHHKDTCVALPPEYTCSSRYNLGISICKRPCRRWHQPITWWLLTHVQNSFISL